MHQSCAQSLRLLPCIGERDLAERFLHYIIQPSTLFHINYVTPYECINVWMHRYVYIWVIDYMHQKIFSRFHHHTHLPTTHIAHNFLHTITTNAKWRNPSSKCYLLPFPAIKSGFLLSTLSTTQSLSPSTWDKLSTLTLRVRWCW